MTVPPLDHVVVDVQDRMDEAVRRYRALGFHLTERGHHSLGSINHLAMFDPDYLELLGTGDPGSAARADLAGFPVGLNGLVFKLQDAATRQAQLVAEGVPALPVVSFSRPVVLPNGTRNDARFNVVRLESRAVFDGRVYFCEHLTPELVWRPEWQAHPNGAIGVARVVLALRDPSHAAGIFRRMFGADAMDANGRTLTAGKARIELTPQQEVRSALGEMMPDAAGRGDYMALLGVRVRSLDAAERALRANGVKGLQRHAERLLVAPDEAMNVALEFVA
ncbi:MAG: VOC family protein [Acetobacteraceae bacterium]